jgi:hypothetical protein
MASALRKRVVTLGLIAAGVLLAVDDCDGPMFPDGLPPLRANIVGPLAVLGVLALVGALAAMVNRAAGPRDA